MPGGLSLNDEKPDDRRRHEESRKTAVLAAVQLARDHDSPKDSEEEA